MRTPINTITVSGSTQLQELQTMIENNQFNHANEYHIFLLHCILHKKVYGVETQEATVAKEKKIALTQCRRLLNLRFENKPEEMIEFIRWFWKREKTREEWRKINKPDSTFRADWRIVFSGKTVSDYELVKARSSNVF